MTSPLGELYRKIYTTLIAIRGYNRIRHYAELSPDGRDVPKRAEKFAALSGYF
jgi:hypothetical protein